MLLFSLGSIKAPLFAVSTIGFALAVFIDDRLKKPKYAKNWDDGLVQDPIPKSDGSP